MKRKLLYVLVSVMLLTLLPLATGCGGDPSEDAKATADSFMSALQEGDMDAVKEYADPALFEKGGDLESFTSIDNIAGEFAEALGVKEEDLSDNAKASLTEFTDTMMKGLVSSYEIGDVKEGEKGAYLVNVSTTYGYDPAKVKDIDISKDIEKMTKKYMEKNQEDLAKLYLDKGEDAVLNKMLDDLLGDMLTKYTDKVMETGEVTQDSVMTVEEIDGKWLVTGEQVAK